MAKIPLFFTFPHVFLLIHMLSTCVFCPLFHIMWKLWIVQISLILSVILMWIIFPQCCGNQLFFPLFHFLHLSTVEFPPVFHVDKCVKIKYTLKIACFQPIFLWKTIFYLSVIEFFHTL